jgi:hypothetical protein
MLKDEIGKNSIWLKKQSELKLTKKIPDTSHACHWI